MKKILPFVFLALSSFAACAAGTPQVTADQFHPPQTEAEKKLDYIFQLDKTDEDIFYFIIKRPSYNAARTGEFSKLFTAPLLKAWESEEKKLVQNGCDGTYTVGENCGFDYSPITCGQDFFEIYLYTTVFQDEKMATILNTSAEGLNDRQYDQIYRLIKDQDDWKLDGVNCNDGIKFNFK